MNEFTVKWGNTATVFLLFLRFGYKTEFLSLPKQSKNLDGSRSLGLFSKDKTRIIAIFHCPDLAICSHSGEANPRLIAK